MRNILSAAVLIALGACANRTAIPFASSAMHTASGASAAVHAPHFDVYPLPRKIDNYYVGAPQYLAVDPKTDNAWWTCGGACGGVIAETTPNGRFPFAITPYYKGTIFAKLQSKWLAEPESMTIGPDGALWFTDAPLKDRDVNPADEESAIGRLDITDPFAGPSSFQGWELPSKGVVFPGIASTRKSLWFAGGCVTEPVSGCHDVYSITTKGRIAKHRDGWGSAKDAEPVYDTMVPGANGSVWMAWLHSHGVIAERENNWKPSGAFHQFRLPLRTDARSPALGSDGAMWFEARGVGCADNQSGVVGRFDSSGKVSSYCLRENLGNGHWKDFGDGYALAAGSDGNIWFVTENGDTSGVTCKLSPRNNCLYLARIDVRTKNIVEYPMPNSVREPTAMATGTQKDLWIVDQIGNNVVRIVIRKRR